MDNFGNVYITGVIGNDYNPDGSIKEKGVELIDVMSDVAQLGEVEKTNFYIKSPGGNVKVGEAIGDFIATIPNAFTIATEQCASIATRIHTSVPLQNRKIEEGTQYMIHNPFGTITGDADMMALASTAFAEVEKELETHYSKATGVSKETISSLMAIETYLTPQQCLSLKFASEIIPKPQLKAVAKLEIKTNNKMSNKKDKLNLAQRMANAMAVLKGEATIEEVVERTAKAVTIETDKGTIDTPFQDLQIGDSVMIGEEVAEDGAYTIESGEFVALDGQTVSTGTVIEVMDGVISAITMADASTDAENQMEALLAKVTQLETENSSLKADLEAKDVLMEQTAVQMEALAKIKSNAQMPAATARFRGVNNAPVKDLKAEMEERKAQYKKK